MSPNQSRRFRHVGRAVATVMLVAGITSTTLACLWDYDTLKQERSRFPQALELITGKFNRHSKAFYEWRLKDRAQRLKSAPKDLALYDDLAAAHDKTGNHDKAVELMLSKDKIEQGKYETYANLGTFHIHGGNLPEGLKHIKKAIEINPEAHFGREVYQKLLVEYVLESSVDGKVVLPLFQHSKETEKHEFPTRMDFADFVLARQSVSDGGKPDELKRAVKGVLGMMRFGNYDSPILLEALGGLLAAKPAGFGDNNDAKLLAARAFLKASYETADQPAVTAAYRSRAVQTLRMQIGPSGASDDVPMSVIERQFKRELAEANRWFEEGIERDELAWIKSGQDVDALFDEKYRDAPVVNDQHERGLAERLKTANPLVWLLIAVLVIAVLAFAKPGFSKTKPE